MRLKTEERKIIYGTETLTKWQWCVYVSEEDFIFRKQWSFIYRIDQLIEPRISIADHR